MIEFQNVVFSYNDFPVLNNFSFRLRDRQNLLITGPSGCGKTTVARLILGLETPKSGKIIAPQNISAVFQEDRLVSKLNVYRNITLPLDKTHSELTDRLINEFGLIDIKYKAINSLSGGMKRRVAIIRAIAYGGDAIVLDEPFNGIDRENILLISEILNREYTKKGKSVIIISHNETDASLFDAEVLKMTEA